MGVFHFLPYMILYFTQTLAFVNMYWRYDQRVCSYLADNTGTYTLWQHVDHTRRDLYCPPQNGYLDTATEEIEKIRCSCCSLPEWRYTNTPAGFLTLEYLNRRGVTELFDTNVVRFSLFIVQKENYFLSALPRNICDFPSIVEIRLSGNRITNLASVSCLTELDTIDLSRNRLTKVSNATFRGLRKLRVINLSHNFISEIEPFSFNQIEHGIMWADFSFNKLSSVDATNVIIKKAFCFVSYRNNSIARLDNALDYKVKDDETFGQGGYIDLTSNKIKTIPDPASFGFKRIVDLGKLFFGKFLADLRDNEIICDCALEAFLRPVLAVIGVFEITGESLGYICSKPDELRGKWIIDALNEDFLDLLVCESNSCPEGCRCYYQPSRNRTVLNCTSAGLSKMDDLNIQAFLDRMVLSESRESFQKAPIEAFFSNNSIESLENTNYMNRTMFLDLSINKLKRIRTAALESVPLDTRINISSNSDIRYLPEKIQRLSGQYSNVSGLTLTCTCEDGMYKWLPEWISPSDAGSTVCVFDDHVVPVSNISSELLGCSNHIYDYAIAIVVPFAMTSAIITFIFSVSYYFRYEIYLVYRKLRQQNYAKVDYSYDVYLSIDESNTLLLHWIVKTLTPYLELRGYRIFLPARDMLPGEVKEQGIRMNIRQSRCFLLFLSKSFDDEDLWLNIEWRNGWVHYREKYDSKLIVVNFDLIRKCHISALPLRAIFRLGHHIDFCAREFYEDLLDELDRPVSRSTAMMCSKPRFDALQLSNSRDTKISFSPRECTTKLEIENKRMKFKF